MPDDVDDLAVRIADEEPSQGPPQNMSRSWRGSCGFSLGAKGQPGAEDVACRVDVGVVGVMAPNRREAFLAASNEAIAEARRARGCLDFVVAADPIEPDRVNVYERWESDEDLEAFRGHGPGSDLTADIVKAEVLRHQVSSSGPA